MECLYVATDAFKLGDLVQRKASFLHSYHALPSRPVSPHSETLLALTLEASKLQQQESLPFLQQEKWEQAPRG